jgi:16S rRNA (guanine527-N7)-methyltransferase
VVFLNSLAIFFPETRFYLIDIIAKKNVPVNEVATGLGLKKCKENKCEKCKGDYDFIVSRAVTNMPDFVSWIKDKKSRKTNKHDLKTEFYI